MITRIIRTWSCDHRVATEALAEFGLSESMKVYEREKFQVTILEILDSVY